MEIYSDTQTELTSTKGSDEDIVSLRHDIKCSTKGNREEIKYTTQYRYLRKKYDTVRYKTNGREKNINKEINKIQIRNSDKEDMRTNCYATGDKTVRR
jgi:hypothetical protein